METLIEDKIEWEMITDENITEAERDAFAKLDYEIENGLTTDFEELLFAQGIIVPDNEIEFFTVYNNLPENKKQKIKEYAKELVLA